MLDVVPTLTRSISHVGYQNNIASCLPPSDIHHATLISIKWLVLRVAVVSNLMEAQHWPETYNADFHSTFQTTWFPIRMCSRPSNGMLGTSDYPQGLRLVEASGKGLEEAMAAYANASARPALDQCTPDEFEADLVGFLQLRGEDQLAIMVKEKRMTW